MPISVKICGLKRVEDAKIVNEFSSIKYVGFVFANTPRKISPETAFEIKKALRPDIKTVGVFTDTSPEDIESISNIAGLDICQLHSNEDNEYCKILTRPVWKAIRVKDENSLLLANEFKDASGFVLDKYKKDAYGGTGESFDWAVARNFSLNHFTILAGGINRDNVISALDTLKPNVIDLSSSVETDGFKDYYKIKDFMERIDNYGIK